MAKFIIGLVLGLLVGGIGAFFIFAGVPGSAQRPGTPIQPPDPNNKFATAQIVLRQDLFNEVLATIFRDMKSPTFPIAGTIADGQPQVQQAAFQECSSQLTILKEGSGVQTGFKFENNRITGPLAFSGSYSSGLLGCFQYTGWAQTSIELRYDQGQQAVFGIVNVETVNLDGVNPLLSGIVTPLVQSSINSRVNPIKIIDGRQIAIDLPIVSSGGRLQGNVDDVRADYADDALNLYITYEFSGAPGA